MNGSFAQTIRCMLMPALAQNQGFAGVYTRGGENRPLVVVPTKPDWVSESEQGSEILLWKGLVFEVSAEAWAATGFGTPERGDRLVVALAAGNPQSYALLPPKGKRPYELSAESGTYFLHMKLVSET